MGMPKRLTAYSGIDALTHALEARVSVLATEFTDGIAMEAARIILKHLPEAYENGTSNQVAREQMHHASAMAGMAFANAFLGVCHSMAHKLGGAFHVPHGLANALLISHVIRFNATDKPVKQGTFPQYDHPTAKARYASVADYLGLGERPRRKVKNLIKRLGTERKSRIPKTIQEAGVPEKNSLPNLHAQRKAFAISAPEPIPLSVISEIKEMI